MKHNERARVAPLYLTFTHPFRQRNTWPGAPRLLRASEARTESGGKYSGLLPREAQKPRSSSHQSNATDHVTPSTSGSSRAPSKCEPLVHQDSSKTRRQARIAHHHLNSQGGRATADQRGRSPTGHSNQTEQMTGFQSSCPDKVEIDERRGLSAIAALRAAPLILRRAVLSEMKAVRSADGFHKTVNSSALRWFKKIWGDALYLL